MASPATRRRASEAGIELTLVSGTGPGGRISRDDFDKFMQEHDTGSEAASVGRGPKPDMEEVP